MKKKKKAGELYESFFNQDCPNKDIGTSTRITIKKMLPKIKLWIAYYFLKKEKFIFI